MNEYLKVKITVNNETDSSFTSENGRMNDEISCVSSQGTTTSPPESPREKHTQQQQQPQQQEILANNETSAVKDSNSQWNSPSKKPPTSNANEKPQRNPTTNSVSNLTSTSASVGNEAPKLRNRSFGGTTTTGNELTVYHSSMPVSSPKPGTEVLTLISTWIRNAPNDFMGITKTKYILK